MDHHEDAMPPGMAYKRRIVQSEILRGYRESCLLVEIANGRHGGWFIRLEVADREGSTRPRQVVGFAGSKEHDRNRRPRAPRHTVWDFGRSRPHSRDSTGVFVPRSVCRR